MLQFDFLVYPNPVRDILFFKSQMQQLATVEIFNGNGQLVITAEKQSAELSIDLKDLDSGIYMYRILTKGGVVQSGTFVKSR